MRFLLDPGHGIGTPGKRSPLFEDGTQLFEWEFTRDIVRRIMGRATALGLDCINVVPEVDDVPLVERVRRANLYGGRALYVSVHANAGGGRGIEVFTSPGETRSDRYASIFYEQYKVTFPGVRGRTDFSDGDPDKEARFYVLTKTSMPAVLTESFFMDNEEECKRYLMTEDGRNRTAMAHLAAMRRIAEGGDNG
jgi:N-acetylmuramoyl-L-alanine amidase